MLRLSVAEDKNELRIVGTLIDTPPLVRNLAIAELWKYCGFVCIVATPDRLITNAWALLVIQEIIDEMDHAMVLIPAST